MEDSDAPDGSRGTYIDPTATVEQGARIGAGTRVWHQAHVRSGASVGERCVLGKNVFIDEGVVVGDRVKIQNNVSVYQGVSLADDVFVGPSVVFTNDRVPRARDDWEVATTTVRQGASIGGNATIVAGVEIGAWAVVGAGAVVIRDVAAHELVVGNPARRVGWVCRCGAERAHAAQVALLVCEKCGTRLTDLR